MSGWCEVKALAEKLKTVQAAESTNYLSERICVDIVSHLINSGRLRLVRTIDGRTLMTSTELVKEIVEELEAHRGRISLLELSNTLEVDHFTVESHVNELISNPRDYVNEQIILVAGQLLTKSFIRRLAEEIRDRLEFRGSMSITELTRFYNFTPQFLTSIINEYNGVLFEVHRSGDIIYTQLFMSKRNSKVLGFFSGTVTPLSLVNISHELDIPQNVLTNILNDLISSGMLKGALVVGKSIYMPSCYRHAQDAYIRDFIERNGYIEWDVVRRFGISDPSSYLRAHFPSAIHTKEFTICDSTVSQIKAILAEKSPDLQWIDVSHYLPQVFGAQEREWLIKPLLTNADFVPLSEYMYLYPKDCLLQHMSCFDDFIREQAAIAATDRKRKKSLKFAGTNPSPPEEGTIKSGEKKGKTGGFGVRSREVKTKNVKKKYLKKSLDFGDEVDQMEVDMDSFLPRKHLLSLLSNSVGMDVPVDLIEGILDTLLPNIHEAFVSLMKSVYLQTSDSSKHRDRCIAEMDSLVSAVVSINLLERGSVAVNDIDLRAQLLRQLNRNEVSTFVNRLYLLVCPVYDVDWPNSLQESSTTIKNKRNKESKRAGDEIPLQVKFTAENITSQQRDALANELGKIGEGPTKEASLLIQRINACLRANVDLSVSEESLPLDEIFSLCDNLASYHLGINLSVSTLRSGAAKRKRQDRLLSLDIASQTEQQMIAAANSEEANSLASLTLAGAALFGHCLTGWPLPVHGKLVPLLSKWISKMLSKPVDNSALYPAAVSELRKANAGEQLARLTHLVMQEVKCQENESSILMEEKRALIDQFISTASRCRQAMQGNPSNSNV